MAATLDTLKNNITTVQTISIDTSQFLCDNIAIKSFVKSHSSSIYFEKTPESHYSAEMVYSSIESDYSILGDILAITLLVGIATYITTMYRHQIVEVYKAILFKYSRNKLIESLDMNIVRFFTITKILLFIDFVVITTSMANILTDQSRWVLYLYSIAAITGTILYRSIVINGIMIVSRNRYFFEKIKFYTNIVFSSWSIIFTAIALMTCFNTLLSDTWHLIISLSVIFCFFLHLILQICRLFNEENVSFLQLILYLCTTDFIPISLFFAIIMR